MVKIIIYAGSFNPVTKGHLLTMNAAIDKVNADKGLFFITHNDYLTRNNTGFEIPCKLPLDGPLNTS